MSRGKSRRPYTNDDEITQAILAVYEEQEARLAAPYDGVLGHLPEWVPEPTKKEFESSRNIVLNIWKYDPDEAVLWLTRFDSEDGDWIYPAIYPCGRALDLDFFCKTIGNLAHIKWAISLGPDKGLEQLGGSLAQRGYKNKNNLQPRGLDKFSRLLDAVYMNLCGDTEKSPSNKEALAALRSLAENYNDVVQEVDYEGELIYWKDAHDKKPLKFSQFNNRMIDVRKRFKEIHPKTNI